MRSRKSHQSRDQSASALSDNASSASRLNEDYSEITETTVPGVGRRRRSKTRLPTPDPVDDDPPGQKQKPKRRQKSVQGRRATDELVAGRAELPPAAWTANAPVSHSAQNRTFAYPPPRRRNFDGGGGGGGGSTLQSEYLDAMVKNRVPLRPLDVIDVAQQGKVSPRGSVPCRAPGRPRSKLRRRFCLLYKPR